MASLNCFRPYKKKKEKKGDKEVNTMRVKLDHLQKSSEATELRSTSFNVDVPFPIPESCRCEVKVMNPESPVAGEVAYEGEDEHDDAASRLDKDSEFNFQSPCEDGEFHFQACFGNQNDDIDIDIDNDIDNDIKHRNTEVMFASGHVSDPGTVMPRFWASPELKRSCSNLAMRSVSPELEDPVLVSNCKSYEDLQKLAEMHGGGGSPASCCTADKVILKKHSSSQILPSGSRKLWWKLFLWSHRNLHTKPLLSPIKQHQHGGYSSDIAEPKHATGSRKLTSPSPSSLTEESADKNWDGFHNQWFAFPPDSSPLWRVGEWVKEASSQVDYDVHHDVAFPPSPDNGASASPPSRQSATNMLDDEVSHANNVIRSLNTNSTVAHISGLGLAAIPSISLFSSLRSLNLSANLIVQITPGSLPKGLHVLNLSRNKISNIEGLRELTRLRVLDLSYNRISRIGQGLSNCTLVKELYLAGNKISVVEGLHRLLKLTVLDLSFNKITTVKALGQLVANYNSLIAVNLLGNPIQSNMSDDLLRKTLCSLLPKLALLNKQPINPQKAREIRGDANAKAALGNSGWNTRRKVVRKVAAPGTSSSHSVRRSTVSNSQRNKHKAKSHSRHHTTLKDTA